MRLKLYRAANVAAAMAQLRADLGPDALILSTRRVGEGVELTAALEPDDEPVTAPAPSIDFLYHDVPGAIAARLAGPSLEAALASMLRFGPLPTEREDGGTRPLLLAGLPGAGKTLSIARLATRMVLGGERPVVITADGRRAGAAEELAAYTRLLGLELMVATTPASLTRALGGLAQQVGARVLIDTSGINPFVPAELAALISLAAAVDAAPVLVMAAGQHAGEAAEYAQAFAPLGARHLLPTRLDLARRLGSVLSAAAAADLILTEAGLGSGATEPPLQLTAAYLADRLALVTPFKGAALPRGGGKTALPISHVPRPVFSAPIFPAAKPHGVQPWSNQRHG